MYMDDAVRASIEIMQAPTETIKVRASYNLTAVSFSAEELTAEILKHLPDFTCKYVPDFRQEIANSWPQSIDDSSARTDWNWNHKFGLPEITEKMITELKAKLV